MGIFQHSRSSFDHFDIFCSLISLKLERFSVYTIDTVVEETHKQICTLNMFNLNLLLVVQSVQLKIKKYKACDLSENKC